MRILVTGVRGFAGGHLAEALALKAGVELLGVSRHAGWPPELGHLAGRVALEACDVGDPGSVERLLRSFQPQQIYHLAGYANAGQSFREPDHAWAGNLLATRTLYDALVRSGCRPRVLYVGSGLIYGDLPGDNEAHHENSPFCPVSPYATSKAAADLLSYQYTRSADLDIVRARPFNHFGPRQSPEYALAHFAQQIAAIERRQQPPVLETGSLTPLRDLTDVRDVVRAYLLLMERGRSGEAYNVATGVAYSIKKVLDGLLALARMRIDVREKPGLVRRTDTVAMRGDAGKLRRETGWAPQYTLERTLADTLEFWRKSLDEGQKA
jgi:GDP-4-dehydro-6-deoxy-D-mannose reductase